MADSEFEGARFIGVGARWTRRVVTVSVAVLALAGRFHVFAWLKRRPECGSACHLCENSCPIGAIEATGKIDMNECLQCLDCQVEYYDDQRCPPLVAERKQRRLGVAISTA